MAARFKVGDRLTAQVAAKFSTRAAWAYQWLGDHQPVSAAEFCEPYVFAVVDPGRGNQPAVYDVVVPYRPGPGETDGWLVRVSEAEFS